VFTQKEVDQSNVECGESMHLRRVHDLVQHLASPILVACSRKSLREMCAAPMPLLENGNRFRESALLEVDDGQQAVCNEVIRVYLESCFEVPDGLVVTPCKMHDPTQGSAGEQRQRIELQTAPRLFDGFCISSVCRQEKAISCVSFGVAIIQFDRT